MKAHPCQLHRNQLVQLSNLYSQVELRCITLLGLAALYVPLHAALYLPLHPPQAGMVRMRNHAKLGKQMILLRGG